MQRVQNQLLAFYALNLYKFRFQFMSSPNVLKLPVFDLSTAKLTCLLLLRHAIL